MAALISEAHAKCYLAFEGLIDAIQHPIRDFRDQLPLKDVQEEFDKYKIWAGNVGAAHSGKRYEISLDYRLREALFFRNQVLDFLARLNDKITNATSLVRGERKPFEEDIEDSASSSTSEIDQEEKNSHDSPWEISSDFSGDSTGSQTAKQDQDNDQRISSSTGLPKTAASSDLHTDLIIELRRTSTLEMPRLLRSIKLTISCLYRMPIRKPAPLDRLKHKASLELSCYQHFDILYVKDKFPQMNPDVATRLGKMVTNRRQILYYRENHGKSLDTSRVQPTILLPPESVLEPLTFEASTKPQHVQSGSQVAMSQTASSHFTLRSKATTMQPGDAPLVLENNTNLIGLCAPSVAESKSSMASSFAGRDLRVEVPRRPTGIDGKELDWFECPYCLVTKNITTDRKWKKHVFEDLQPYVCTYADCNLYDHFFHNRDEWYKHEVQHHRVMWFCNTNDHLEFDKKEDFLKHMEVDHKTSIDESHFNSIQEMFRQPTRSIEGTCNLCMLDSKNLKSHVSRHLQQIALFALPRVNETPDSGKAERDTRSSKFASKGNRKENKVDMDSQSSYESSTRQKIDQCDLSELPDDEFETVDIPESTYQTWDAFTTKFSGAREGKSDEPPPFKRTAVQEDAVQLEWSREQEQCHRLFRLTKSNEDTTYEWYKDRVEDRVAGTCEWFLHHSSFQAWLKVDSGLLLVSADPGCGKSVLAKYLIDHGLPQSSTVCYFFFKDQDQNKVRQALCALLHQLFSQKPSLIDHAMPRFRKDGQGLVNSTQSLWTILGNAVKDPRAGSVILVLDALDECTEADFENLVRNVKSQLGSDQTGHGKLKYLLTSRPYNQMVSQFRDHALLRSFPNIRIPGEEESEAISQEVNRVISHRVNLLSEMKAFSKDIKSHLEKRLLETTHRTYLWVYLVFDHLGKANFKKTQKGVESIILTLPKSIHEAYDQILNKSKDEERPMVRKALSIILAANRPLTLKEMNVAMNIDEASKTIHDVDLEDEEDFKTRLRYWCGLFVSIHHGSIYFLHQTVREFLLADLASPIRVPSELHWHHSITTRQAHTVLAEACVLYLNFFNSDDGLQIDANEEAGHSIDAHTFLDYSAKTWGAHFREAGIIDNAAIIPSALRICDPDSKSYMAWFGIYWRTVHWSTPRHFTSLMVAAHFGHQAMVRLLLAKGANIEAKDDNYQTPLWWAAWNGHEAVVKLLLDKGANVEAKNQYGQTSLLWAAEKGHEAVAKLLLDSGADIEAKGYDSYTPLLWAAEKGYEAVVRLLLDKGANIEAKGYYGHTPLWWATEKGHEAVVRLLLDNGADIEAKGYYDQTPLLWVAEKGYEAVAKLLLEKGADVEAKDQYGRTPLLWAAEKGHKAVVRLLLEKGADVEVKDQYGRTPLLWAAEKGHKAVVRLLLDNGADIEAKGYYGQTPLLWAAEKGYEAVAKLLLEKGADVEAKDQYGRTPLLWAAEKGHKAVVRLLLDNGADIEAKGYYGQTPLLWVARKGYEAVVKLLLNNGADVKVNDQFGQTPLLWAAEKGHEAVVQLLLDEGADVETKGYYGQTPLLLASWNGYEAMLKLLLDKGANVEAHDEYGRTPLSWLAEKGQDAVVKLLQRKSR